MSALEKIDAVSRKYFNPVDAVKLYTDTKSHTINSMQSGENPFANTRSMGLWQQPTLGYVGQVNGEPPTQYTKDESGMITEVTRTLNLFA